jgi:hypothetical protein
LLECNTRYPVACGGNRQKKPAFEFGSPSQGQSKMDQNSQQLLIGTFIYVMAIGGLIATLGAVFGA